MSSFYEKFSGTGVAMVTPFLQTGEIDWNKFQELIEFWIQANINYLVALGTTGESATVHGKEKQDLLSFVAKKVNGRVPLVAGIGGNYTKEVITSLTTTDLTGYDAILSVCPYYNKPNKEGIFHHFKQINDQSPLPIILYNVPSRAGTNIDAETQLKIANLCPNIFATKEASGDLQQISTIIQNKPKEFIVLSGDDALTLPMIALGADGVISVVANVYPEEFSTMVNLCLEDNFDKAREIHYQLLDIIQSLFTEGSPSGAKAYLSEMGLCQNIVRLPVAPVSNNHIKKIRELIKNK